MSKASILGRATLVLAITLASATRSYGQRAHAGPFIPLGSRLDRLVAWAIGDGALGSIDPLVRPYRMAAVSKAALREDTTTLTVSGRRSVRLVLRELAIAEDTVTLSAELAGEAYSNGRRDTFRPGGKAGRRLAGGIWASVVRGPVIAVVNPAFQEKLRDDPEFTGVKNTELSGRMQTAYVAVSGETGDLLFGRVARNWGPDLFDGLMVSPSPYAFDAVAGALRISRFELTSIGQRLDDWTSPSGMPFNRYFLAHRLSIHVASGIWLGFVETGVYGGPGRGFEPSMHAPLNLALLSELNEREDVNILLGAEAAARLPGRLQVAVSGFIDDIQEDRQTLTDRRPTSYGLTFVTRIPLPRHPVHLALGYTRVSSLAYRNTFDPAFEYSFRRIGLARNFSDYDQLLLRLEALPGDSWYLALDLSYLRQGSGDFRDPFPSDSVLAMPGQGFLVAPVRTAPGIRATVSAQLRPGWEVRGELGVTRRLDGRTEAILGLSGHVRVDALRQTFGAAFPGIELGANRGWP